MKAGKNIRKIAPPVEVKLLVSEGNVVVKKDKNNTSGVLENKEKKTFYFNPPPKVGAVTTGGAGAASSAATSSSAKAVASKETPAATDKITRDAAGQPSAAKGKADEPPADGCTTHQPGKAKEQPGPPPDPSSKEPMPKNKPTIISETALLEKQKEEQFFMKHPSQNNLAQERQTFAPERQNIPRPHFPGVDQFVFFPPVVEMKAINVLKHKDFLGGCPKITLPPYEEICDRLLPMQCKSIVLV